jgi:acyl-CoA dehydrogenase
MPAEPSKGNTLAWESLPLHLTELCARVRDFVDQQVIPYEPQLERPGDPSRLLGRRLQHDARAAGLWALGLPKEIGGGGMNFLDYAYVNEIVGRSYHALSALGTHITQDALLLHYYGTDGQKKRWLEPMVAGEMIPSFAVTEPDVAGSDPKLIQTRAERHGDTWVINGHKWVTTHADVASFTVCMAVTDPDAPARERASLFIVPTDTPGYHLTRVIPLLGDEAGGHCDVLYEGVELPAAALLGARGGAFDMAQRRLGPGRIYHVMRWIGQMQRALELLCQRAATRFAHGSMLADKQTVQNWIADSAADITATRLMTLDAAKAIDSGADPRLSIAMVKYYGAEALHRVIDRAVQVHGVLGVSADSPLDLMYRRARFARLYDGPDEVHRMTVARVVQRTLGGVPRDRHL